MRADLPAYELATPATLDEALALLAADPGAVRPLAGGTDVMVLLATGKLEQRRFVSLWGLAELRGIEVTDAAVTFGALTTYSEVREHELVRRELPMLAQAASETGGLAIQNRGTLAGNVANASPAADSGPALLAYDAELELRSRAGARWVRHDEFHTGYKQTVMRADELIARIRVPRREGARVHYYRKVGPRAAQAISKVCFAGCADRAGVRVALGGVAPVVLRCRETERALAGGDVPTARAALQREIAPIDDIRSSAKYRRRVAANLLDEFIHAISL